SFLETVRSYVSLLTFIITQACCGNARTRHSRGNKINLQDLSSYAIFRRHPHGRCVDPSCMIQDRVESSGTGSLPSGSIRHIVPPYRSLILVDDRLIDEISASEAFDPGI